MGLKDLLQDDGSKRAAKRALKGSAAFTSALLLGNKETGSKGLLHTLGSATGTAAVGAAGFFASMAAQSSSTSKEEEHDGFFSDDPYSDGFQPSGPEGPGYYEGGMKMWEKD